MDELEITKLARLSLWFALKSRVSLLLSLLQLSTSACDRIK